jgi:hypothetical protein
MSETQPQRNRILARLSTPQTPPPWGMVDIITMLVVLGLAMLLLGSTVALIAFNIADPSQIPPVALLFGWSIGLMVTLGYTFMARRRTPEQWAALRLGSAGGGGGTDD